MADEQGNDEQVREPVVSAEPSTPSVVIPPAYDEFEVGEHKVPWFLWVFFILIVAWASVSWIQFFGY